MCVRPFFCPIHPPILQKREGVRALVLSTINTLLPMSKGLVLVRPSKSTHNSKSGENTLDTPFLRPLQVNLIGKHIFTLLRIHIASNL